MTDPTGLSFVSYRRSRTAECTRLVAALRERGIPTWRDVDDLNSEPTETELRRVLGDDSVASAILWISPETADSSIIRKVEAPVALDRHARQDGFFVVPVAAGGLGYEEAAEAIRTSASIIDVGRWNIVKLESDPASQADIAEVANRVLRQRLQAIDAANPADAPLRISLNTRQRVGHSPGTALTLDWSHKFGGIQHREAEKADWQERLLPSLRDAMEAIQRFVPHRRLLAGGLCCLPAATALGYHLMATAGIDVAWEQRMPDGSFQQWSMGSEPEESGFSPSTVDGSADATDLAVLVSVNNDVSQAVAASSGETGPFRAYVHIKRADSGVGAVLDTPGQVADVARKTVAAARNMRTEYRITGRIHLFAAIPAGLAMLIGQLLNTLGPVQTYEHIPTDATGIYKTAGLLG